MVIKLAFVEILRKNLNILINLWIMSALKKCTYQTKITSSFNMLKFSIYFNFYNSKLIDMIKG